MDTTLHSLNGDGWRLATDPRNEGRQAGWFNAPRADARPTRVPWIIQDAFPGYHGVAWYWRTFDAPAGLPEGGRHLLRFWAVDYLAEVWLNGVAVGVHEGGESPFVLDVTDVLRPGGENLLAVRVLNPTHEPIDGIVLNQTPHRNKEIPYRAGADFNHGGIVDSVELRLAPAVRLDDLFVRPDVTTGVIRVEATVHHAGQGAADARLELAVAPAAAGETLQRVALDRRLPPGETRLEAELRVAQPKLWSLGEPNLYRVTARLDDPGRGTCDELSVRCGFREFTFADGHFRLNGRRLFLRCSHTGNNCPIGLHLPDDPDLHRRDLVNVKAMGFNAIRFIAGVATRAQLELCDELGLLVYEEPYAAWCLEDSPNMAERYDESLLGMVRRDRNHPSVVIWGLLNETNDDPTFRHAVALLPQLRALDDTRLVLLNSGRWDLRGKPAGAPDEFGSLSVPGSCAWQDVLDDEHPYPHAPHTEAVLDRLRQPRGERPLFISEYGIGSAVDLCRVARHYEQRGGTYAEDAVFYRDKLDRFLADYERWHLDELFARPEDFFTESLLRMAAQRRIGLNAIRANPAVVAHSLTGTIDQGTSGEGLVTTFRELKPGTIDALFESLAPLRLCLFVDPVHLYRGAQARCEVVLANEDVLAPGQHPVRLLVVGPENQRVFERTITVTVTPGQPFAVPVFAEDVAIDGPAGRYRFLATFQQGGAATGGEAEFWVADPAELPAVDAEVALAGDDPLLAAWLAERGLGGDGSTAPVILIGQGAPAWDGVWARVERGATAVILSPGVLKQGDEPLGALPLAKPGTLSELGVWGGLYLKDEWARRHPIFAGLPCGGLMDPTFYRELIGRPVLVGQEPLEEAVAGGIKASADYGAGLLLSVHRHGAGRVILSTLLLREHLGSHPVAERLLRNLLHYAAG